MHMDQIKTFLEVAATGNFNKAARNLNVTQSTVSARIQTLEEQLRRRLFDRNHSGARLTPSGERLMRYATSLQRLWGRAEKDISLPKAYRASVSLGSAISLWDQFELQWVRWMRQKVPDVAVHLEADYSPGLMRHLTDGALDIGVMYEPRQVHGLVIEELLADQLHLLTTNGECRVDDPDWRTGYALIDWGEPFKRDHDDAFPELVPELTAGLGPIALRYILAYGGSAYFPLRMVCEQLRDGTLLRVRNAPVLQRMGCVVYSNSPPDPELLQLGLTGLREATKQVEKDVAATIEALSW